MCATYAVSLPTVLYRESKIGGQGGQGLGTLFLEGSRSATLECRSVGPLRLEAKQ